MDMCCLLALVQITIIIYIYFFLSYIVPFKNITFGPSIIVILDLGLHRNCDSEQNSPPLLFLYCRSSMWAHLHQ